MATDGRATWRRWWHWLPALLLFAGLLPVITAETATSATAGARDVSFGTAGIVRTDFGGTDKLNVVVVQPDGKIIAAGSTVGDADEDLAVARYNTDGSLDSTFGSDGKVTTDIADRDIVNTLVVQPDGKIVVAGDTSSATYLGESAWVLLRYLPTGEPDTSFGDGGRVITDYAGNTRADHLETLLLQPDGKLLAAGYSAGFYQADSDAVLARYNSDGSPDRTFGSLARRTSIQGTRTASPAWAFATTVASWPAVDGGDRSWRTPWPIWARIRRPSTPTM